MRAKCSGLEGTITMAKMETVLEQQKPRGKAQEKPAVRYAASALPLLTPDVQNLLNKMLPLMLRESGAGRRVEVYGTAPSDEMEAQLVVSVKTDLSAKEAFALWDHLGDRVQEWTATLPISQQSIASEIAVEVLWSADNAAC